MSERQPAELSEQAPKKRGRPSRYKPEIIAEICERLSAGEPLATMCRENDHLPAWQTVYDWMAADPEIAGAIARARDAGEEVIGADCMKIADTPQEGVETVIKPDGSVEERRGDMLGHRKLRIETRLKLLAKWNPKRWGERITQEVSGPNGGPLQSIAITTEDPVEAARAYQELIKGQ